MARTKSADTVKAEIAEAKERNKALDVLDAIEGFQFNTISKVDDDGKVIDRQIEQVTNLTVPLGQAMFYSFVANDDPNVTNSVRTVLVELSEKVSNLRKMFDTFVEQNKNPKLRPVQRIRKAREVSESNASDSLEDQLAMTLRKFNVV